MELKGFKKVALEVGETKTLTFNISYEALSLWNSNMEKVVEPGEFEIMVGKSATDIILRQIIRVK